MPAKTRWAPLKQRGKGGETGIVNKKRRNGSKDTESEREDDSGESELSARRGPPLLLFVARVDGTASRRDISKNLCEHYRTRTQPGSPVRDRANLALTSACHRAAPEMSRGSRRSPDDGESALRRVIFSRSFIVCCALAVADSAAMTVSAHGGEHGHLLLRQTLAVCSYDRDCVDNAYCWNQETCLCMEGYLVDRNRTHVQCLRIATDMGDPCTEDVQCRVTFTAQAECRNNACGCSTGSHFEEGRCYESVGIGHVCQTSHNCYVDGSASFCDAGYCTCPLQHHPNSDRTRCLRSSDLGQDCSSDEECVATHSRCLDVCGCKVDYVVSNDGKRCLKAANIIGDSCEEDSQCKEFLKNAKCGDEGKCTCNTNFKRRGSICHRDIYTLLLGKRCSRYSDCLQGPIDADSSSSEITRVDCIDGVCSCTQNYTLTEDGRDCIGYSDMSEFNGSRRWQIHWTLPAIAFAFPRLLL